MTLRLIVVLLLVAAFAIVFSELVKRADSPSAPSPCEEWSNPDCRQPAPLPPQ
ncbi:MAG: hypothetical protein WBA88_24760 [Pseudaminobacter sp.]